MSNISSALRSRRRIPRKDVKRITLRSLATTKTAFDSKDVYAGGSVMKERELIVPFELSEKKLVPGNITRPPYANNGVVPFSLFPDRILLHDKPSIDRMRNAARLARRVLDHACSLAKPGVESDEIDTAVHEEIIRLGAYPSPLNYHGFPKSLCSSINVSVTFSLLYTGQHMQFLILNLDYLYLLRKVRSI
jgi:hypothetical protein